MPPEGNRRTQQAIPMTSSPSYVVTPRTPALLLKRAILAACASAAVMTAATTATAQQSEPAKLPATKQTRKAPATSPNPSQTRATAKRAANKSKGGSKAPKMTMEIFLDRLMLAESGGRDFARNSRSTAYGAYQFINQTFLSVMRNHFPERIADMPPQKILALRADRKIARDAARAYTKDNAVYLVSQGHKATFPHLRLAYLLGPAGAARILSAKPETPLVGILGPGVIRANPFMRRLTAAGLIQRAANDISAHRHMLAGLSPKIDPKTGKPIRRRKGPRIRVRCNLGRPSCRRWLSLKRRRLARAAKRRVSKRRRNR